MSSSFQEKDLTESVNSETRCSPRRYRKQQWKTVYEQLSHETGMLNTCDLSSHFHRKKN